MRISRNAIQKQTSRSVFRCEKFLSKTDPPTGPPLRNLGARMVPRAVFSLLERMYDEEQRSTLGDAIQASLMLAYNKRRVG